MTTALPEVVVVREWRTEEDDHVRVQLRVNRSPDGKLYEPYVVEYPEDPPNPESGSEEHHYDADDLTTRAKTLMLAAKELRKLQEAREGQRK